MSENRTTELRISEPLRGFIRHQSNRAYIDGGQARWLTEIADEIDAKSEQAVAATLGGGELTAELKELVLDLYADLMEYGCTPNAHRANYKPRFEALGIEVSE